MISRIFWVWSFFIQFSFPHCDILRIDFTKYFSSESKLFVIPHCVWSLKQFSIKELEESLFSKKKKNRFHEISSKKKPKNQVGRGKIISTEIQFDEKFSKKKKKNFKTKNNSPTIISIPKGHCLDAHKILQSVQEKNLPRWRALTLILLFF